MSGILHSTEEAFIMFVANRIAESDWKNMLSPSHILSRMEDDDENEIKDYVWDEVKASINWNSLRRRRRRKQRRKNRPKRAIDVFHVPCRAVVVVF